MRRCVVRCVRFTVALVGIAVGLQVVGNAAILASSLAAKALSEPTGGPRPEGIDNFRVVDDRVWRGAAPTESGYRWLAAQGVTTIIDLRAERSVPSTGQLRHLDLDLVRLPVRDGQLPTQQQIQRALSIIDGSDGTVFVHCSAGVGRTGAVIASYLVATGRTSGLAALMGNLAVGPPSLEQIAFVAGADGQVVRKPSEPVLLASRFLDAPRKLWGRIT